VILNVSKVASISPTGAPALGQLLIVASDGSTVNQRTVESSVRRLFVWPAYRSAAQLQHLGVV
jgi:hypothetical protein